MSIAWQEELAVGIESIDNQHKEIFTRFALFSAACSDGAAGDELLRLVEFLEEYSAEHFRDEEKSMADAEYPQLASQEQAHAAFLGDLGRLREEIEGNGPEPGNIFHAKRAMVQYLINHIRHLDRAFADFLNPTRQ